eukprot:5393760-Prymnesium_polylepis.1
MIDTLIDGSKTGFMRYTGCVAETESGIKAGVALKEYSSAMGLPTKSSQYGPYQVEHADQWV